MNDNAFDLIEQALLSGGPGAGFDFLARRLREEKRYAQLFEALLLKKRYELGLPLIQVEPLGDLPDQTRRGYEEAFLLAAREVGSLFLAEGDIQRAWSYFRAIGEPKPVAEAIELFQRPEAPREEIAPLVEIAFHEGVNPRKGFELILAHYGVCQAITSLMRYPDRKAREGCIGLLVSTLHRELVRSLKRAVAQREGQEPDTVRVPELIRGRDWLFEDNSYYIDTSHVVSVLQFSIELADRQSLALALELTEYGARLAPLFQHRLDPPFENVYSDHAMYLRALLGEDVEGAIAHFRGKIAESHANRGATGPAQVLVRLLVRLGRPAEAIEISLQHLHKIDSVQLACPSVFQLCHLAGDHGRLMTLAREEGDLVSYTAAALQK